MTKRVLSVALVAALAFLIPPSAGSVEDVVGQPAPDFTLKSVRGKNVSLNDFKGTVVLLDFWAVWCGPCRESLPFLEGLAAKYRSEGFAVIGLHVDDRMPPLGEVKQFLKDHKVRYTNLISTWEVDEAFQIYAMPTSYLVDREGRIQHVHIGFDPSKTPERVEGHVRAVLGVD